VMCRYEVKDQVTIPLDRPVVEPGGHKPPTGARRWGYPP
jgi:hypothetical protein